MTDIEQALAEALLMVDPPLADDAFDAEAAGAALMECEPMQAIARKVENADRLAAALREVDDCRECNGIASHHPNADDALRLHDEAASDDHERSPLMGTSEMYRGNPEAPSDD